MTAALTSHQYQRCRSHSFALTRPAEFFRCRGFDAYSLFGNPAQSGDVLAHPAIVRREFRLLRHHGDVDVHQLETLAAHDLERPCQQFAARDTFETDIAIGEMGADIAFADRAKDRVDQSMEHDVSVGMTLEPLGVGDLDTADHESASAHQAVYIEAVSNATLFGHV